MSCVSVDIGSVDIYFESITEDIVRDCTEHDLLNSLASAENSFAMATHLGHEKEFCLEAARRLRELADWFENNQPHQIRKD
jgi:hypothetical protein